MLSWLILLSTLSLPIFELPLLTRKWNLLLSRPWISPEGSHGGGFSMVLQGAGETSGGGGLMDRSQVNSNMHLKGRLGPWKLPASLFVSHTLWAPQSPVNPRSQSPVTSFHNDVLCYKVQSNKANWPWTETAVSSRQHKIFFFLYLLSHVFCHSYLKDYY